MKITRLVSTTFLFLSLVSAASAVEIGYTASDLGSITGVALNDTGQVVGWRAMGNGFDIAFVSGPNGVGIRSLGALPGDRFSHATGINNSGQVTGFSELHPTDEDHSGIPHAFLSGPHGGPLHDIASLAGAESAGNAVNNVGQVTGYAKLPAGLHAFLSGVNGSAIKDLGNFNGPLGDTMGTAVNDRGQVAGISNFTLPNGGGATHAFLSGQNGGALKDLGTLGGSALFSQGDAVNNLGQVAGSSTLSLISESQHAFLSGINGGALIDLGTLGGSFSVATGISDAGVVVGFSTIPNELVTHAFVYTTANGMQDLNSLIAPALGFQLSEAFDVNELGQIVATGFVDGELHTFLLTPTNGANIADTGSSGTLLSCGLLGLLLFTVIRATRERFA